MGDLVTPPKLSGSFPCPRSSGSFQGGQPGHAFLSAMFNIEPASGVSQRSWNHLECVQMCRLPGLLPRPPRSELMGWQVAWSLHCNSPRVREGV